MCWCAETWIGWSVVEKKQWHVEEELEKAGVRIGYVLEDYADTPEGHLSRALRMRSLSMSAKRPGGAP